MFEFTTEAEMHIKRGFQLCNSVGIIDSDYRDEVKVLLYNTGIDTFIHHGDRIAQLELDHCDYPNLVEVNEISEAGTEKWAVGEHR